MSCKDVADSHVFGMPSSSPEELRAWKKRIQQRQTSWLRNLTEKSVYLCFESLGSISCWRIRSHHSLKCSEAMGQGYPTMRIFIHFEEILISVLCSRTTFS